MNFFLKSFSIAQWSIFQPQPNFRFSIGRILFLQFCCKNCDCKNYKTVYRSICDRIFKLKRGVSILDATNYKLFHECSLSIDWWWWFIVYRMRECFTMHKLQILMLHTSCLRLATWDVCHSPIKERTNKPKNDNS